MNTCSCGQCLGTFLSPRTVESIKESCVTSADLIKESIASLFPEADDRPIHDPPVFLLDYVPPELRLEVTRRFVEGFATSMGVITYVLRQGQVPKPSMLSRCSNFAPGVDKEAYAYYVKNGGTMEYVLDAVISQCQDIKMGDNDLPICKNDCEWKIYISLNSGKK